MMKQDIIQTILKDSNYHLALLSDNEMVKNDRNTLPDKRPIPGYSSLTSTQYPKLHS